MVKHDSCYTEAVARRKQARESGVGTSTRCLPATNKDWLSWRDASHAEFTMLLKIATGERSGISARLLRDDAACRVAPRIWQRPTTTRLVVCTTAAQRKGWFAIGSSNKVYAVFSPHVYVGEFGGFV